MKKSELERRLKKAQKRNRQWAESYGNRRAAEMNGDRFANVAKEQLLILQIDGGFLLAQRDANKTSIKAPLRFIPTVDELVAAIKADLSVKALMR